MAQQDELTLDLDDLIEEAEEQGHATEKVAETVEEIVADPDANDMMSTKQAAAYAGVSVHYMRNLMKWGRVEAFKNTSGHWRISRESVDAYLDERQGPAGGEHLLLDETDGEEASIKEAAELAGISPGYMRQLVVEGKIDGYKDESNRWHVNANDAREYERTREQRDGYVYVVWLTDEQRDDLLEQGYEVERKNKPGG